MVAHVNTAWIAGVLGLLPRPLLAALDGWSQRLAQRRAARRREAWLRRTQRAAPAAAQPTRYRLQPWRD
jgi:hypothetical protein